MADDLNFSISLEEHVSEASHKASAALKELASELPGVAIGLIGVGVAMLAVAAAGTEMALEVRAANASLEATFDALGKGPEAGKKTLEMLEDVGRELPQSREELAKWARAIEKMGVTDLGQVRRELLATASAQGILGEEGPAAYEKLSRKVHDAVEGHHKLTIAGKELTRTIGTNLTDAIANRMGLSLDVLEQKLKAGTVDAAKFGEAMEETFIAKGSKGLDAMWMSTGKITKKIHDAFGEMFKDVDTGPIIDGLRTILSILDATSPSAQGMEDGITSAFNGIVKTIGDGLVEVAVFFLTLEVAALELSIAFKPLDAAISGITGQIGGADAATASWKTTFAELEGIVRTVADAISAISNALGGNGAEAKKSLASFGGDIGLYSREEVSRFHDQLNDEAAGQSGAGGTFPLQPAKLSAADASGAVASFDEAGMSMGDGLVKGMDAKASEVQAAGRKLGEAATNGVKEGTDSHSPSVKARRVGGYVSEGLALGMVDSAFLPARAGRQIGGAAIGGMAGQALAGGAANQNGGISISGLTIHITAPQGVTDANALSASGLVVALERLQLASGR